MIDYVVGFLFNTELTRVTLVLKNRPAWQAGKWNGVGGKIEPGESVWAAMSREFREETGVDIGPPGWRKFATIGGEGWELHALSAISTQAQGQVVTTTDEAILTVDVADVMVVDNVIPNVPWLIQMALSFHKGERAEEFSIVEINR